MIEMVFDVDGMPGKQLKNYDYQANYSLLKKS